MAEPTYTYADLKAAVAHAHGRSSDSNFDNGRIVNAALRDLLMRHQWRFLKRSTTLSITATAITGLVRSSNVVTLTLNAHGLSVGDVIRVTGADTAFNGVFEVLTSATNTLTYSQSGTDGAAVAPGSHIPSHLALPADFDGIVSLRSANSTTFAGPATMDEILEYRQGVLAMSSYAYSYAINYNTQSAVTSYPAARLELYPTPDAALAGAFNLSYVRTVRQLSDDTDVPDILKQYCPLLQKACRAFAHSEVEPSGDEAMPEWATYLAAVEEAKKKDGMAQPMAGRLRNQLRPAVMGDYITGWTP